MKYRSARGRPIDWNALANNATVPATQRELQRSAPAAAKPSQRFRSGHVPSEAVEEVVEAVEEVVVEDPKPKRGRKQAEEPTEAVEPEPTE